MRPGEVSANATRIAESFVAARRAGTALGTFPGDIPADLAGGYAVQDAALSIDGRTVAGWKVGRINPPLGGIDRLAGPIFADQIVAAGAGSSAMPVFADGFAATEGEFLLRVGTAPDPAKRDYTLAEARALIDAVHIGIEIASSPFGGINDHGPAVTIADYGNNNGLVVGPELDGWRDGDINAVPVEVFVNGESVGAATTAAMLDGPFGAAAFLFASLAARGIKLAAGQWISSGAVTGVHRVAVGDRVEARFGAAQKVECTISA